MSDWKNVQYKDGKMRTSEGGGGDYAHHYSETEQVIGTWIDGKPIYEKTVQLSNSVFLTKNQWNNVEEYSNIDTLVNGIAYRKSTDQSNVFQLIFGYYNGYIRIWTPVDYFVTHYTIQYTKTTD